MSLDQLKMVFHNYVWIHCTTEIDCNINLCTGYFTDEKCVQVKCTFKSWYFIHFSVFLSIWMYRFGKGDYVDFECIRPHLRIITP